jgi:hypothetical protein
MLSTYSMKHESKGERYSCCSAALQLAHSRAYGPGVRSDDQM